ncbi:hypothetical protein [Selenomonas sp.]|uniref:hypothetical protein n=1 Tax=Selenomonas sp. TaxID=2053611 RepID=UPI0025FC798C|nr:hypothetical protein [Selenomonas sp.]MBQ1868106.1 hypothetical protein [Selenomonas sp.]
MFAWVEVLAEKNNAMEIAYSLGTDMNLDGRIRYDKVQDAISLEKLSDGASPQATRDFMEALRERLQEKKWGSGQAICVSYSRSVEPAMANRWQMDKQASFVRFG